VKSIPLLEPPAAVVTTTFPVVVPAGTTASIDVSLQLLMDAAVMPLNFTVLVPCVPPKPEPVILTVPPTTPLSGVRLVILVDEITVKTTPLLGPPPVVVTTTFPVVASAGTTASIDVSPQLLMDAAVMPLNFTVLVPCVPPKPVPVILTVPPTTPLSGVRLAILVAVLTVKTTPLLGPPAVVVTTTFPVVAPAGTVASIDVSLQLVMDVVVVPLNFTVLVP
jgi:hypothetical protein